MKQIIGRRFFGMGVVIAMMSLVAASPLRADGGADEGITVTGDGTVKGKPSEIEIEATISSQAELANDARVKYQDTKKKALAALDALKNPDLSVKSEGPSVSQAADAQAQMRAMQGMAGDVGKPKVQISESLKIDLKGVDKLDADTALATVLKIIDTCHDAGLQIGPPAATNYIQMQVRAQSGQGDALVSFKIPDKSELENQAYAKAIADAKAKAERIAKLNNVTLGKVLAVQDTGSAAAATSSNPMTVYAEIAMGAGATGNSESTDNAVSADSMSEIPVTVHVTVKYEIQK